MIVIRMPSSIGKLYHQMEYANVFVKSNNTDDSIYKLILIYHALFGLYSFLIYVLFYKLSWLWWLMSANTWVHPRFLMGSVFSVLLFSLSSSCVLCFNGVNVWIYCPFLIVHSWLSILDCPFLITTSVSLNVYWIEIT